MSHITSVESHGTIVLVFLNDRPQPVAFDHRMFSNMVNARLRANNNVDLSGECHVEEHEGQQTLVFDEDLEDEPCGG